MRPEMRLNLRYFAALKEAAGCESEQLLLTELPSLSELYRLLQQRHGFPFCAEDLRVARNGALVDWQTPLEADDEIAFLPPYSGG